MKMTQFIHTHTPLYPQTQTDTLIAGQVRGQNASLGLFVDSQSHQKLRGGGIKSSGIWGSGRDR